MMVVRKYFALIISQDILQKKRRSELSGCECLLPSAILFTSLFYTMGAWLSRKSRVLRVSRVLRISGKSKSDCCYYQASQNIIFIRGTYTKLKDDKIVYPLTSRQTRELDKFLISIGQLTNLNKGLVVTVRNSNYPPTDEDEWVAIRYDDDLDSYYYYPNYHGSPRHEPVDSNLHHHHHRDHQQQAQL